jgi:hypothetical protein
VLVAGVTEMATGGFNVIIAIPVLVVSAWLVAVTVTACCDAIVAGAVYRPAALMAPALAGLIDHVTAEFAVPVTVAVNCCVCPGPSELLAGETATLIDCDSAIFVPNNRKMQSPKFQAVIARSISTCPSAAKLLRSAAPHE